MVVSAFISSHLFLRHWGLSLVMILSFVNCVFTFSDFQALSWRWKVGGREEKDKINDSPSGNINFPFAPMLTCGWNQNGSNKTKRLHCNENKTEKRKKPKNSSLKNLIIIGRLDKSPLFSFQKNPLLLKFSLCSFSLWVLLKLMKRKYWLLVLWTIHIYISMGDSFNFGEISNNSGTFSESQARNGAKNT